MLPVMTTSDVLTEPEPLSYEEERGKPMPSFNHGWIQANLIGEFLKCREFRVVSELDIELDGKRFVPDLSVYRREPVNVRQDTLRRLDPPLVTAEIVSPMHGHQEIMDKVAAYLAGGVQSCWVVTPPILNITIFTPDGRQRSFTESGPATDPATGITADLTTVFS